MFQKIIGSSWFPSNSGATFINFILHGWSPDNKSLLYSFWNKSQDYTNLYKMNVASMATGRPYFKVIFSGALSGATWANLR